MTCSFGTVTFVDVLRWWFVHWEDRRCWHRLSRCPRMMEAALGSRSRWRWCSRSSYRSHSEPPDFGGTPQWYHIIFLCFPGDTGFLNSFFPDWYSWPAEQRLPFRYNALRTMYWWLDRKVWKLIRYLIYVWIRRIWSNSVSNPFPPAAVANQSLACALNNIFISDNIIDSWISKNNADDWEKKTFHAIHPNKHCSFPGLRIQIQDIGNLWHLWRQRDEGSHCTCVCKKKYIYLFCFLKLKVCMRIYTYIQRM